MTNKVIQVQLYVDGSALGNPGVGGYAAILRCGQHEKVVTGGSPETTTNHRMELTAVIAGLQALKTTAVAVDIYTDSQYVAGQLNGQRTRANHDLVAAMRQLVAGLAAYRVIKVDGHAGDEGNERCDLLARQEARRCQANRCP